MNRPGFMGLKAVVGAVALVAASACSNSAGEHSSAHSSAPRAEPAPVEVWRWAATPPAYVGMPAADSSGVAFTSALSRLVLLDGAGQVQWFAERRRLRDVAPLLMPDLVVAATEDGLVAYSRAGGRLVWDAEFGERANSPVLAADAGAFIVSTWHGSLIAVDARSGQIRWRAPLPGPARGPASVSAGTALVTWAASNQADAGMVAVASGDGRQRWAAPLAAGGVSAPTVVEGAAPDDPVAVVVAGDVAAHAMSIQTGNELWHAPLDGAGSPEIPPLRWPPRTGLSHGVIVGHRLGGVQLLSTHDGRSRWGESSDGASVRGGLSGPGPTGRIALPLDDGRVLVAGPDRPTVVIDPPGRVSGVALGPGGLLLVATREAPENALLAYSGW